MLDHRGTMMRIFRFFGIAVIVCSSMAQAAFEARPGVRAAAMGHAYSAAATDAYAAFWNPALLPRVSGLELAGDYNKLMYQLLNNDLCYNSISLAFPGCRMGTCALSYSAFNSSQYYEQRYGLNYGVALIQDRLYWGFSVEGLELGYRLDAFTENDPFFASFGNSNRQLNMNAGLALDLNRHMRLALTVQHLNQPNLALQKGQPDRLPLLGTIGLSAQWAACLFAADVELPEEHKKTATFRAGGEWRVADPLRIQFGYGDRYVSGGIALTALICEWDKRSFEALYSHYLTTTTTLQFVLEYAVRYPLQGLKSDYGSQYAGFRMTLGKRREISKAVLDSKERLPANAKRIMQIDGRFDRSRIQNQPMRRQRTKETMDPPPSSAQRAIKLDTTAPLHDNSGKMENPKSLNTERQAEGVE